MARFRLTQEDINRGKLLDPGWYNFEIVKVYDDTTTMKGETGIARTNVDMQVVDGPFVGAVITTSFNEKFPSYVVPFLAAFGIEVQPDEEYDLSKLEKARVKVFIGHREYQNKQYNDPKEFRPYGS